MGLFNNKELSEVEKNYYSEFCSEEKEMIVLVKESCNGAAVQGDFLTPSVRFVASIDPRSNEFKQEEGILSWIIPRKHKEHDWGFPFEKMNIYKVCVRKCYERELDEYQSEIVNRRFFVVKILEHIESEPRLNPIREAYLKPVYIDDEVLGRFTLDREYQWFEGNMDWMGNTISVLLETDEDNDSTAECAFTTLKNVASDIWNWNGKIRKYAAEELTELANEWNEEEYDEDEEDDEAENDETGRAITEEDFAKRIEIDSIHFHSDGSFEITCNDDDMFFGHWVVVYVDEQGIFERADMEG